MLRWELIVLNARFLVVLSGLVWRVCNAGLRGGSESDQSLEEVNSGLLMPA